MVYHGGCGACMYSVSTSQSKAIQWILSIHKAGHPRPSVSKPSAPSTSLDGEQICDLEWSGREQEASWELAGGGLWFAAIIRSQAQPWNDTEGRSGPWVSNLGDNVWITACGINSGFDIWKGITRLTARVIMVCYT